MFYLVCCTGRIKEERRGMELLSVSWLRNAVTISRLATAVCHDLQHCSTAGRLQGTNK